MQLFGNHVLKQYKSTNSSEIISTTGVIKLTDHHNQLVNSRLL